MASQPVDQTMRSTGLSWWTILEDPEPRSHRFDPAKPSPRKPRRSAAVRIPKNWLADARGGSAARFDLGAGMTAKGTFRWANRKADDGVRTFAGTLTEPPGMFHLEHHEERGWSGSFRLTASDEMVQLVPDREEQGVTRLESWPRREIVCASAGDSGPPFEAPVSDPSINHNLLQSRPGAPRVIYLDFDGETVSGTVWNVLYNSFDDISVPSSGMTRDEIIAAWARAAEDWAPFNVNVTTSRLVYQVTNPQRRCMVVCTTLIPSWAHDTADTSDGGMAFIDSFANNSISAICWCWNVQNYFRCAETISHEVGHTMGLSDAKEMSGDVERGYYHGHETDCGVYWAPIMGRPFIFDKTVTCLTQFTKEGTYPGSTVEEPELDEIIHELGLLPDEHLDSAGGIILPGTALALKNSSAVVQGLLNSGSDVDAFSIELPAGTWHIWAGPNSAEANVDVWLELQRMQGAGSYTLLRRSANQGSSSADDASHSLSAQFYPVLEAGIYRIRVGSDHCAGPYGYSNYGGLGTYTLRISPTAGFERDGPVLSTARVSGLAIGSKYATAHLAFRDASPFDPDLYPPNPSIFPIVFPFVHLQRVGGGVSIVGSRSGGPRFFTDDSGGLPEYFAGVSYRFEAPGGWWDSAEAGDYRVDIQPGVATDKHGNFNEVTIHSVGSLEPDTVPPMIQATAEPSSVSSGSSDFVIVSVQITDQSPLLVAGNGTSAFEAISASGGPSQPVVRWLYSTADGGRQMFLKLAVTAPAGGWHIDDTSVYHVVPKAGAIRDAEGNPASLSPVASFSITTRLWKQDFEGMSHGFALDAGWETGVCRGTGGALDDPSPDAGNETRVLGYALGDLSQYGNNLNERSATTPAINTQGYERLTLHYRRWLTVRAGDLARIEVNDGTTNDAWTTVWTCPPGGNFSQRSWTIHEVPLPHFVDNGTVHIRWIQGGTDSTGTAGGWNIDDVEVLAAGTFQPARLVFNPPRMSTSAVEGGANVSYTIRLNQQPTQAVSVNLMSDAQSDLVSARHVFSSSNWNVPQAVTVKAVDDGVVEGSHRTVIHHSCSSSDLAFDGATVDRVVGITDNESPLILGQPEDGAVLPGQSIVLSLTPARVSGIAYQWYSGRRGDERRPIAGATNPTLSATLPSGAAVPVYFWVRVYVPGRQIREEHSRQVTLSPLTGLAAFKQRLLQRGYSTAQINAPGFEAADPDGNGLSHFTEHAVGILPGQTATGIRKVELVPAEGGGLRAFDVLVTLPPLQPDVVYLLQTSSRLTGWVTMAEVTGDPLSDPAQVVRIPHTGAEQLLVKLAVSPRGP